MAHRGGLRVLWQSFGIGIVDLLLFVGQSRLSNRDTLRTLKPCVVVDPYRVSLEVSKSKIKGATELPPNYHQTKNPTIHIRTYS